MILQFPDRLTLEAALTSGAVPAAIGGKPAAAEFGAQGETWVEVAGTLPPKSRSALHRLGVRTAHAGSVALSERVNCWPQLLPLESMPESSTAPNGHAAGEVLFDCASVAVFQELSLELLRLGADRQSFRALKNPEDADRYLLRVMNPPYFTLLRALESSEHVQAYRACGPRVWLQLGYRHPLESRLRPAAGKLLLLRPARVWEVLPEGKFTDLYEALDFDVTASDSAWQSSTQGERLRVPLRLVHGETSGAAELWVFTENGTERLNELVQNADQRLLEQLAFAVVTLDEREIVLLRARPGRAAPVLTLDAAEYRSWQQVPNLFVPRGMRLRPSLRQSVLRELLAPSDEELVWLTPRENGGFTPCRLDDSAFRPLESWVDYIVESSRTALQAWAERATFEFDAFVIHDPPDPGPVRATTSPPAVPAASTTAEAAPKRAESSGLMQRIFDRLRPTHSEVEEPLHQPRAPAAVEQQLEPLRQLEQLYFDQPAKRAVLWPKLARAQASLGHAGEAGACWREAIWTNATAPADWRKAWLRAETQASGLPFSRKALSRISTIAHPSPAQLHAWVAYLNVLSDRDAGEPGLDPTLAATYLEQHEGYLGVQAAWLGWEALDRLRSGDVLLLARARDRLLERLHQGGLTPEVDLPMFLRGTPAPASSEHGGIAAQLEQLEEHVAAWRGRQKAPAQVAQLGASPFTTEYVELIFAFGFARLGERDDASARVEEAYAKLVVQDDLHHWLATAYANQIGKAGAGHWGHGPLSQPILAAYSRLPPALQYKADKLRGSSRILEPTEHIDAFARHLIQHDEIGRQLADLEQSEDPAELKARVSALLDGSAARPPVERAQILAAAFDLGPKLGEQFCLELLQRCGADWDAIPDVGVRAALLERALFAAGHFGQPGYVQALTARLKELVQGAPSTPQIDAMLGHSLYGLRRFGMRDEAARLIEQITALAERAPEPVGAGAGRAGAVRMAADDPEFSRCKLQMQAAAGWLILRDPERAWPIFDAVRDVLFAGRLPRTKQTDLAVSWIRALAHAPQSEIAPRLEALFQRLDGICDAYSTNTHFALSELSVVESAVFALLAHLHGPDDVLRARLEEEEFSIRRRIHQSVQAALARSGPATAP